MRIRRYEAAIGRGLAGYANLLQRTARVQLEGYERLEQARASGRPVILAAWHGMTTMSAVFLRTYDDPSRFIVIVPDDTRGATLSTWARSLGIAAFPISMDDQSLAGARRLIELVRTLRAGKTLYIAPDGPSGPTHEPKAGLSFIARRAGAWITPIGAFAQPACHVPRWDRYTLPLPFARIAIAIREPFELAPNADTATASGLIQSHLNDAERAAEALWRQRP